MAAMTASTASVAGFASSRSAFKGSRVAAVAPRQVAGGRATLQVRTLKKCFKSQPENQKITNRSGGWEPRSQHELVSRRRVGTRRGVCCGRSVCMA